MTFSASPTPFDDEVDVGKDDERRGERRFLLVLHDDAEPIELPDLVRELVCMHEDSVEHGDQQVQQ